jgi:hypothetical protein
MYVLRGNFQKYVQTEKEKSADHDLFLESDMAVGTLARHLAYTCKVKTVS